MSEKLVLIDGHSILFRAFYGMPISMTGPDGLHTNAIYGFLSILTKVIEEEQPDYLAVAFDLPAPTFRHKMYPEYKGTRNAAPDEFREQVPVIKDILLAMEIPVISAEGWEADDVLGTLSLRAEEQGMKVAVISGDRDLLQLASDRVQIIIPKTKGGQTIYERYLPEDVEQTYGVNPSRFIELKALMGDTSDNVPGLPGVGPKTAAKILEKFGTIEHAHDRAAEITPRKAMEAMRDHYDQLLLSLELVKIRRDAPVALDLDAFRVGELYTSEAYGLYKKLGFRSLLSRFHIDAERISESSADRGKRETVRITEISEFEQLIKEASQKELIALSILAEEGRLYAAAVVCADRICCLIPAGFLTQAYIGDGILRLLRSGTQAAVTDAKEFLKLFGPCDGARLFDIELAAYLIDPLKSDWSYFDIASAYLGKNVPTPAEVIGKKGLKAASAQEDFEERLIKIASVSAETSFEACSPLGRRLAEMKMDSLFFDIEMPLAHVLAKMEKRGILTSREELGKYGKNLEEGIDRLKDRIWEAAGETFNLNSPKQLGVILFEKMGLPGGKKTKTGYSTAADVLEKLAGEYPIANDLLEYRTLSKLKSTYADGLPVFIRDDGRIHTTFHQKVTATGRLSSTDPNLQNIPMREELGRAIRKCFFPKAGCVFADADYSQIELRILAHMSGDEKLIKAYNEAKDIHRITASQVFHVPFEEVTELQRRNAKAVNFGIVYGISSFGLSQGLSISRKEAQDYIEQYFRTYPKIKSFLDGLVEDAKKNGCAVSLFGRKRPIPELKAANFMQRSFGERAAMNSPIQGTAADIMKIAMLRVEERLERELPEAELILQIHDELLVEVPEAQAEQAAKILREEMMAAADLRIPLETDCHIGRDWYEAK